MADTEEPFSGDISFPTSAYVGDDSIVRPTPEHMELEMNRYKGRKLAVVTVGLPARGKFYIARKLCRWMNWIGIRAKLFRGAVYRHAMNPGVSFTSDFFHPDNKEGADIREQASSHAVTLAINYLSNDGQVVLIEGQNVTRDRRDRIRERLRTVLDDDRIIFLEVSLDDGLEAEKLLERALLTSYTYSGASLAEAKPDYVKRQQYYLQTYQSVDTEQEANKSWIKYINNCEELIVNKVGGYLPTRVVNYLMQVNVRFIPIYCSRHGQSEYNLTELLGGDSELSPMGRQYAIKLTQYVTSLDHPKEDIEIWTSTLKRTKQTAQPLKDLGYRVIHWRALDEINAGICDGWTYKEVDQRLPEEFAQRKKDKYNYRYPSGESYHDLMKRLEPLIMELERVKKPLVIVCHQAVLRCLYSYLNDQLPEQCVRTEIPLHTVFKFTVQTDGSAQVQTHPLMEDPSKKK